MFQFCTSYNWYKLVVTDIIYKTHIHVIHAYERLDDTSGVIRIRNWKDRQYNGHKIKINSGRQKIHRKLNIHQICYYCNK